ncbi:MAG: ATP-grasp domain-containing protein [Peptococcia bacterium]
MKIQEKDFVPVILGSDINTYGLARSFYEEYQIKSIVIGKFPSGPSCHSRIIDYYTEFNMDKPEVFLRVINNLAERLSPKKMLLIGCGDNYVEQIVKNRALLKENVIAPYIAEDLLQKLLTKQSFYEMCERYNLDYPQTYICEQAVEDDFVLPFELPVIIKPSSSIKYWEHGFPGQKKVYKIDNYADLRHTINQIFQAGYDDTLIIQEYIPGDDSCLRIMVSYSGQDQKVKVMSLAHVLLEEYTPQGLGSTGILYTDYNEELSYRIKAFLENIGYVGFATFDIKYDQRDGKYKVLELNCRQGRSSYYVTAAGCNLAKYVTEDYLYDQSADFQITKEKILWTVIPISLALRYVKGQENLAEIRNLVKAKKVVRPLFLKGDNKLKRMFYLYKSFFGHFLKYRKYFPHK